MGERSEEIMVGTKSYLVQIRLKCQIPNGVPLQEKKKKMWYPIVKVQCLSCFGYHPKRRLKSFFLLLFLFVSRMGAFL